MCTMANKEVNTVTDQVIIVQVMPWIKDEWTPGRKATLKELEQLNVLHPFQPIDASMLTTDEWQQAIASLIILTEQRDGTIKAWTCADGRNHHA